MCLETLEGFEGDFFEEIGQGLGLAFRKNSTSEFFLLTQIASRDPECKAGKGRAIAATLRMPKVDRDEWFAVSFDCSDPSGAIATGEPVIGIFKKSNDQLLPEPAEKAWLVDRNAVGFRPVSNVSCRSFK